MAEYKILFVDEVESDIRRFKRYVHKTDIEKNFELIAQIPRNKLEDMLNYFYEQHFDAIITDHKLHEENPNIEYDGIELVQAIQNKMEGFPCFVLTSFDDEAIVQGDDVNIIYIKGLMDPNGEEKAHATFLDKIKNQIIHYRTKLNNAEEELVKLIEKSKNQKLDAKEEARLVYLDNLISSSLNNEFKIPEQLKGYKNLQELHKMIENTDKLIEKLEGLKDE